MKKEAVARELGLTARVSGGPPANAKPRLLLVDDERQVLDALALHFRRKYEVVTKTSGKAALEALEEGEFVAIVSDLRMPHMNGLELLAEVKRRAPGTTRLLLTGFADLTSAITAINEAGIHRLLTKPCPAAQVARALDEALAAADDARVDKVDEKMIRLGRQATLGTMAGSIGQEIGNLVGALSSSLEQLQEQVERGEVPASADLGLLGIVKSRLVEHTKALKDLSSPRSNGRTMVDAGALACRAVDVLKKTGVMRIARVNIEMPVTAAYVDGDAALLEVCFINLLKNSAEALVEKIELASLAGRRVVSTDAPRIDVRISSKEDGLVEIVIEDNGPGISDSEREKVWKPYFTTRGPTGGTGLGLAIVRETVERHGGRVSLESKLGEGCRFVLQLPGSGCPSLPARMAPVLRLVPPAR